MNNGRFKAMTIAGSKNGQGYMTIKINKKSYKLHRLAWILMTGSEPRGYVDHINRNKSDNRWCNLREASAAENQWNHDPHKSNKSGVSGVHFCKRSQRWKAACKVHGKRYNVGTFREMDQAVEAITRFRVEHHGEYAAIAKATGEKL